MGRLARRAFQERIFISRQDGRAPLRKRGRNHAAAFFLFSAAFANFSDELRTGRALSMSEHMNKPKILVVDDDPKLSRLVKAILEKTCDYEVQEENRPSAALATASAFVPDMFLLDINMPGKDGGEIARELRADPLLCEKPVLFFTSLISHEEAGKHEVERGGMRFLAKPLDPAALVASVGRILRGEPVPAN